jgi:hypothetical protein
MTIQRLLALMAVTGVVTLARPAWSETETPPASSDQPAEAPEAMSDEDTLDTMEQEFSEEQTRLKTMHKEAVKRKDHARIKALAAMERELMQRREAKVAELKGRLGEDGFERLKAACEERRETRMAERQEKVEKIHKNADARQEKREEAKMKRKEAKTERKEAKVDRMKAQGRKKPETAPKCDAQKDMKKAQKRDSPSGKDHPKRQAERPKPAKERKESADEKQGKGSRARR